MGKGCLAAPALKIASELGEKAKNLLRGQKKFGSHSVNALLKIENKEDQAEIAKKAIWGRWTDRRVKKEVDDYVLKGLAYSPN